MTSDPGTLQVGFLGLGRMGSAIARNVGAAGFPLTLWNRTRERAEALADEIGAEVADSPAAVAATADVVMTMVADDAAVESVYLGGDGVVTGIRAGTVAVDLTTVDPATSQRLAAALAERGAGFVDAPVSGSTGAAQSRSLTIMTGGEEAAVASVRPVLDATASAVYHLGPVGSGAVMKLAVNGIVYGLNEALSEALVLAERAGIERSAAYEVIADSAVAAPVVHYRRDAFEHPGEGPVMFRLTLGVKDLRLIADLAARVGAPAPQATCNLQTLRAAEEGGFADWDLAGLAEWLRRQAARADPPTTPSPAR